MMDAQDESRTMAGMWCRRTKRDEGGWMLDAKVLSTRHTERHDWIHSVSAYLPTHPCTLVSLLSLPHCTANALSRQQSTSKSVPETGICRGKFNYPLIVIVMLHVACGIWYPLSGIWYLAFGIWQVACGMLRCKFLAKYTQD